MDPCFGMHNALYDLKMLKAKCKQLGWDYIKKLMEEKDMDGDYQHIVLSILGKAEMDEKLERERENVISIDEEDKCDGENDRVHNQISLQQVVTGKNVVRGDYKAKRMAVVWGDDEHLYKKPGRRNKRLMQHPHEHVDQARPVKKYNWKNIVKEALVQLDKENFCQKPSLRNNWLTRNRCGRVGQVQPGKKDKVRGQTEMMKLVKQEKVLEGRESGSRRRWTIKSKDCKAEKDCLLVAHGYEGDIGSDKKYDPKPRMKWNRATERKIGFSNQMPGVQSNSAKKTQCLARRKLKNEADNIEDVKGSPNDMGSDPEYLHLQQSVKLEDDRCVHMHKGKKIINEKIYGLNDQKKENPRKLSGMMRQKVGLSNQMPLVENQHKHRPQSTSVKKTKDLTRRKSANKAVKVEDVKGSPNDMGLDPEYLPLHQNVKLEDDHYAYMHKGKAVLNEKINGVNDLEKEGKNESGPDVEILDSAAIIEEGFSTPFVPSKRHKSLLGRSSVRNEFREQVLNVLNKPFDKEEYARHQEAVKCYLDHHPDLRRKLKNYRYNRRKRLSILRGFIFWIQNLTQDGSFKPWINEECLAVEIVYP